MEMGNRYGINLGNILTTASDLKTAKMRQNKLQREEDTAIAGEKLWQNKLGVNDGAPLSKNELNRLRAKAPKVMEEIKDQDWKAERRAQKRQDHAATIARRNRKEAEKQADIANLVKFFQKQGLSNNEATLRAKGYGARINSFKRSFSRADKNQQMEAKQAAEHQAKYWYNLMEVAKVNPEEAQRQFSEKRTETIENIARLNKIGTKEAKKEAERLQRIYDAQPKKFDMTYGGLQLSEATHKLMSARDLVKEQLAKEKYKLYHTNTQKGRTYGQRDTQSKKAYDIINDIASTTDEITGKRTVDKDLKMKLATEVDKIMNNDKNIRPATAVERALKSYGLNNYGKKNKKTTHNGKILEGSTSTYKGKPIIYHNGKWEYK